jgi:hypothetical protein
MGVSTAIHPDLNHARSTRADALGTRRRSHYSGLTPARATSARHLVTSLRIRLA